MVTKEGVGSIRLLPSTQLRLNPLRAVRLEGGIYSAHATGARRHCPKAATGERQRKTKAAWDEYYGKAKGLSPDCPAYRKVDRELDAALDSIR